MWTTRRWRSRSRAPFFFASYSYFCLPNADVAAALQSNGTSERARIRIQIQSSFAPRRRRSRSFAGLVRFPHSLLLSGSLSPACHPLFFARSPALARPQNVSTHSLSPPCPSMCACVCVCFFCVGAVSFTLISNFQIRYQLMQHVVAVAWSSLANSSIFPPPLRAAWVPNSSLH